MRINLSDHTIDALALIISGGSQSDPTPSIGLYRAGWKLQPFFDPFGVKVDLSTHSRPPATKQALRYLAFLDDPTELQKLVESAADGRDFIGEPERHNAVVDYLNQFLVYDNLKLEKSGVRTKLVEFSASPAVVKAFSSMLLELDFDTVQRDLDRALVSAESDPEDAVTAACSIIESVCRSIFLESNLPLPPKQDISGLYRAVRDPLGLCPTKNDVPELIAGDVRSVSSGLSTAVQSIGALRTHGGDAHGRERGFKRMDARIARLAIHSASAIALFLIETWKLKFPDKVLLNAGPVERQPAA